MYFIYFYYYVFFYFLIHMNIKSEIPSHIWASINLTSSSSGCFVSVSCVCSLCCPSPVAARSSPQGHMTWSTSSIRPGAHGRLVSHPQSYDWCTCSSLSLPLFFHSSLSFLHRRVWISRTWRTGRPIWSLSVGRCWRAADCLIREWRDHMTHMRLTLQILH